ncbi:hypothetical protein FRC16_005853 [Serendipita sp. 398]|nr:hypothetical protein FRC16_005853 [Serendipita sp. 398]
MKVSWSLIDSTNTENSTFYSAGDKFSVVRQWNLYRDAKAIPGLRTPNTDIPVINLYDLYCVDDPTLAPIATLGQHKFDSVITEIEFTCSKENDAFSQPLFGYPLDVWTGSIVLVLTDRITAEQAHSSNCFVLGIRGAFIRGSILNWYISSIVINTCEDPDPDAGCEIHVKFVVRRSYIVKAIALIVVFIGWATTIVVLILTYKAAILQKSHAPTDVLAVCLASLLALPSLRAILPGVPSFGAIIDLIGIIPNVIVILSCAIFTVTKALH